MRGSEIFRNGVLILPLGLSLETDIINWLDFFSTISKTEIRNMLFNKISPIHTTI